MPDIMARPRYGNRWKENDHRSGPGNVGYHTAKFFRMPVPGSLVWQNSEGAIHSEDGLDIDEVFNHRKKDRIDSELPRSQEPRQQYGMHSKWNAIS